jgi:hypothetical protein
MNTKPQDSGFKAQDDLDLTEAAAAALREQGF